MNEHITLGALALLGAACATGALAASYDVTTVFHEPDTQPRNTIFVGSFDFAVTQVGGVASYQVTNLRGRLSESMTGDPDADPAVQPDYGMTWLTLSHPLVSWHDATLGGTFAAAFRNPSTATFSTLFGGDGWSPAAGIMNAGAHSGFPVPANNAGNAYALIFVPDDPLAALTQAQIDKLAYADCAAGGMMMQTCMTGTAEAGYGSVGTMSGHPLSQTITVAAVPEPESYALMLAGLALVGFCARRRFAR